MNIVFRTDASRHIGTGHVMRCLTLATALRERGAKCRFVSRKLEGHRCDFIAAAGFPVHRLQRGDGQVAGDLAHAHWLGVTQEQDARETRGALGGARADWLVVDHYGLDARWETAMRDTASRIAVIDDLADRDHDCELLLDHNLQPPGGNRYATRVPAGCTTLLGPRYALLRPEFAAARARLDPPSGEARRVLVFFGGVDANNFTALALEALRRLSPPLAADVVAGAAHPHLAQLRGDCARTPGAHLYENVDHMAVLMSGCDLAAGAGGVTAWERACMGLPSVIVVVAENQRVVAEGLAAAGAAVVVDGARDGGAAIAQAIEALRADPARLRAMAQKNLELVDGRGAQRLARLLCPEPLTLRRAAAEDREHLHQWRNSEDVRRQSLNTAAIPIEDHNRWFADTLARADRALLIAEAAGKPVGVLRFDLADAQARVSIYLVPGNSGRGFGAQILRAGEDWLREQAPQARELVAEIRPGNAASISAFTEAGYSLHSTDYRKTIAHARS